eukprot:TRINITY_DN7142_c1_g1_i1.p1 TRINITY_DN7142_c1_g1~~TRINITY_DN7142_c1_g1_i1.p1  ORF type:complete len:483 (-),score=90.01 TRINITY_DN7142_c1_g1_i1:52-1500(-)
MAWVLQFGGEQGGREGYENMGSNSEDSDESSEPRCKPVSAKDINGMQAGRIKLPGEAEAEPQGLARLVRLDSPPCQFFIGCVVFGNVVLMWWETDYQEYEAFWQSCQHFFTMVFLGEMLCRISELGTFGYFSAWCNVWDFFLLSCAVFVNWVAPSLVRCGIPRLPHDALMWLRLVNALRVMRLFTMFRTMLILASGFLKAIQAVLWVGLIIVVLIYVVAVCLTRIIGHSSNEFENSSQVVACWSGECSHDMISEQVWFYFGTVPRSMYTLFMVMTLTNWPVVVDIASVNYPLFQLIIVAFIVMTTYTLLSLLTAVITDNIITAVRNDQEQKMQDMEQERSSFLLSLKEMFNDMDEDGNALLSRDEFQAALEDENLGLVKHCATLGIGCTDGKMDLSNKDLLKLFDMIALIDSGNDGNGECSIEEFITGFSRVRGSAKAEDILTLQYDVTRLHSKMDSHTTMLSDIVKRLDGLGSVVGVKTQV